MNKEGKKEGREGGKDGREGGRGGRHRVTRPRVSGLACTQDLLKPSQTQQFRISMGGGRKLVELALPHNEGYSPVA